MRDVKEGIEGVCERKNMMEGSEGLGIGKEVKDVRVRLGVRKGRI